MPSNTTTALHQVQPGSHQARSIRRIRDRRDAITLAAILLIGSTPMLAQWDRRVPASAARSTAGQLNLEGPIARTPDGRPDLSGLWQGDADGVRGGVENGIPPKHFVSITSADPLDAPFQPWAREVFLSRLASAGKDAPGSRCEPVGVPGYDAFPAPYKIVQQPGLIVVLHEYDTTFRQVFTDGRRQPKNPQPTWMGYSVGRWERDTLVVDTRGFNDRSWLDAIGHPHTDAMHVEERFTPRTFGRMDIEVTIDDPKAYTRPLTFTQRQHRLLGDELIESFCVENERDRAHFVGQ